MEINQTKKEKKLVTLSGRRTVKKPKRIFVSPLDKHIRKLVRKKPVINVSAAPKQAVRINTENGIKYITRAGIRKGSARKHAKAFNIKRGKKTLRSIIKPPVPKRMLVNRRRIIAAKRRKGSK